MRKDKYGRTNHLKFKPGDLVERKIDNEYYYKQMQVRPEYGIVLEVKDKGEETTPRSWAKVLWVGNEPRLDWHIISSRMIKVYD
tara:strand:- start:55 stop:306 length:252 start_codon:yes stop_codon:yes gene_type:complete